MVGHGGSSAGSYLADLTSPIPSHCASIVVTSTVRVKFVSKYCIVMSVERTFSTISIIKVHGSFELFYTKLYIHWAKAKTGTWRAMNTLKGCIHRQQRSYYRDRTAMSRSGLLVILITSYKDVWFSVVYIIAWHNRMTHIDSKDQIAVTGAMTCRSGFLMLITCCRDIYFSELCLLHCLDMGTNACHLSTLPLVQCQKHICILEATYLFPLWAQGNFCENSL